MKNFMKTSQCLLVVLHGSGILGIVAKTKLVPQHSSWLLFKEDEFEVLGH